MKRMHLSRKVGNLKDYLNDNLIGNLTEDLEKIKKVGESTLNLPLIETSKEEDSSVMFVFADDDFEGKLSKKDIANNADNGHTYKENESFSKAIVSIVYDVLNNFVGIQLLGVLEDEKVDRAVILRDEEVEIVNSSKEMALTKDSDIIEEVEEPKTQVPTILPQYESNIRWLITSLFGKRYFNSTPSEELIQIIINKVNSIYLKSYLEDVFSTTDNQDGIDHISRLLNTL